MRMIPSVRSLLFALVVLVISAASLAQVSISVRIGPPPIPVYEQPPCPAEGYIWTPGYWAYDDAIGDYYWVPGTWVLAPEPGFLWTPGYWGWNGVAFIFYEGYWGPRVGFYGGINYGFGYFGEGFEGGRWDHDRFFYNRSVTNVNVTNIHNVYNTTVINNTTVNRVSYNGGEGGLTARPTPEQEAAKNERHVPPVAAQTQHVQAARGNPELRASTNHGKPPIAATPKPGALKDSGAVPAKEAGGEYNPSANRGEGRPGAEAKPGAETKPEANEPAANLQNNVPRPNAIHPNDLPPRERPVGPNTGDPKLDQKYQRDQEKLFAKQDKERQKLQQQQEKDHQNIARQNADEARKQQMEQQHQQQTQQLQQRHAQQMQQWQEKHRPAGQRPEKPGK